MSEITTALSEILGESIAIAETQPVGGGSISSCFRVQLADGQTFAVKQNTPEAGEMFTAEAAGLRALEAAKQIAVVEVVGTARTDNHAWIALRWIETGRATSELHRQFGAQLARLHRATAQPRYGFDEDNFIGATPQPNGWHDDWLGFFATKRLGFQLALARERGLSDRELDDCGARLLEDLPRVIDIEEPGCLLHGDLWSGNYMCSAESRAVLIDPACYYGHREAELAMTELFGGFPRAFYDGYQDIWPLESGSARRIALYKLYHLLNHLNLFGRSYRGQCLATMRGLL